VTDHEQQLAKHGGLGEGVQALLGRPKEITPEALHAVRAISPVNRVKPGMPPVLLIHGDADQTVPIQMSLGFQRRLQANRVPCELITLKGAPHGMPEWARADPAWTKAMLAWLEKTLGGTGR
jgi:dipeptidyl aminopeptidase/acylaminoacyl peptidase